MNREQLDELIRSAQGKLEEKRLADGSWRGSLSSSAISTAVATYALFLIDREKYETQIRRGAEWLLSTMKWDGSWGDSEESPSNMTATLLAYAALYGLEQDPPKARDYLKQRFGGFSSQKIIQGVLAYYGKDLTFSVPILVMCALTGVITKWNKIPSLPFEASVLPQGLFRFLRLPVVSYAIPALIAVGILRYRKGRKGIFSWLREGFVAPSLRVLTRLQPAHGGFLEAAPLTAFVAMCLCGAGFREHEVTRKAALFLETTVRRDGSWAIDTNLSSWVTFLSVKAFGGDLPGREQLAERIRGWAFKERHPFTGARPGGWGWTSLQGSVPDADDTSGALVALFLLSDGTYSDEVGAGIEWLLALRNKDGGIPTFCKGWGKLPFDRSSPDISAHAFLAFQLWESSLPEGLRRRCAKGKKELLRWLSSAQAPDGSWTPLWFGDQDTRDERSPIYGTAIAVEYLLASGDVQALEMAHKGIRFILAAQNEDGGWGGQRGIPSKVTLTSRALAALASLQEENQEVGMAIGKGLDYLFVRHQKRNLYQREPIGLYFARLWYSEELYSATFLLNALRKIKQKEIKS